MCEIVTEPEGIEFNRSSIEVNRIKEDAQYEGVRVRFYGTLAKARIPMQIDIGLVMSSLRHRQRSNIQRSSISLRPCFRPIPKKP